MENVTGERQASLSVERNNRGREAEKTAAATKAGREKSSEINKSKDKLKKDRSNEDLSMSSQSKAQ